MRDRVAVSQCVSVVFALAPRPTPLSLLFFFNDTATTEIYTLSLHDALPISIAKVRPFLKSRQNADGGFGDGASSIHDTARSEEHTSELQSQSNLVCRLLLEKKKKNTHRRLVK